MSDSDAILFANSAFYAAFDARDMNAMANVWANGRPVSCIHPGRSAILGREAVVRSWTAIMSNPEALRISCHREKVQPHGDTALVTCIEKIAFGTSVQYLMATNVFVREGALWAMVHHQAGALDTDPGPLEPAPRAPLN